MELCTKSFAGLLFLIGATYRFQDIRPIGFTRRTHYSKLFVSKLFAQYFQAILQLMLIILHFIVPLFQNEELIPFNEIYGDLKYISLLQILNVAGWIVGGKLLAYEYRKRLSETYYTHWFYWTWMFIADLAFLVINYDVYVSSNIFNL